MEDLNRSEKSLPFSIDSEQVVLGTLIMSPETLLDVVGRLKPADFYRKSHQVLYAAFCMLYNRQSEVPDFLQLTDFLEKRGRLAAAGGSAYLTEIGTYATGLHGFDYHVSNVEKKATFRRLIEAAAQIAAIAYSEEEHALEQAEQTIFQISEGRALVDLMSGLQIMTDYINRLDYRNKQANLGKPIGLSTGFYDLDQLLGGLQPQELYILGGRPGQGKTSFLLNIILNLLEKGQNGIAIYSLEMSRNDLANRLVSMKAGIDSQLLRTRTLAQREWESVIKASDALGNEQWFVDESGKLSMPAIRHKCRRHKQQYGLDLIVVDYLQLMEGEDTTGKRQYNRVQEVGEISRGLKQLAKDLDVPVLAAASLSRASEQRQNKRPQLSDLRESGSIESDADVVMFISRCMDEANKGQSVIEIAKHRNGPVGELSLIFDAAYTKFRDLDAGLQPASQNSDEEDYDND